MDEILRNIEDILIYPLIISEAFFKLGAIAYGVLGLIVLLLFSWSFVLWRISAKKRKKEEYEYVMPVNAANGTNEPVAKISPEGFGKIINKDHIVCGGKEYKYFIIQDKANQAQTLAVNTIVVVLKRSSKEAHIRPATKEEITSIKKRGIVL